MQIAYAGDEYADINTTGWTLSSPSGDRTYERYVVFQPPLAVLPVMHVALSVLDADATANVRVNVIATNVSTSGFSLRIEAWADTILYAVKASWLAIVP
ncbi:MAG: hypothetical protein QOI11_2884 [Candidatus Eremiobacteraeota bacterium]|nr:hypothetical protein [Candidatus Eremiobacteraeota bacterium]